MSAATAPSLPLHPQLQAMLDKMSKAPLMHTLPLALLREGVTARFAGRAERLAVSEVADLVVPGPAGNIPVRLYHPQPGTRLPLVIFIHGGGFVMCDLDTYDPLCRRLSVGSGCAVASIDYRLAPEHPFPVAPEDCLAASIWLERNAERLGADPTRIALVGDSAGASLVAATTIALRDTGAAFVKAQLLIYPTLDAPDPGLASYVENATGTGLDADSMAWCWSMYYPGAHAPVDARAAPLRAPTLAGLPPAYVVTAQYDVLRDEGEAYAARLADAGVSTRLQRYPDMNHGFLFAAGVIDRATEAMDACCAWLAATLTAQAAE